MYLRLFPLFIWFAEETKLCNTNHGNVTDDGQFKKHTKNLVSMLPC